MAEKSKPNFVPFEVRIALGSPVILSYPWIMFDSLLAHLVLERDHPDLLQILPCRDPVDIGDIFLPLAKVDFELDGRKTYLYRASCSRFMPTSLGVAHLRKKIAESNFQYLSTKKRQIDVVRGPFKAYDMTLISLNARECIFYGVGDIYKVQRLLDNLNGLGKKRAAGYGRVTRVNVEQISGDLSFYHPSWGYNRPFPIKYQAIPAGGHEPHAQAILTYKPPYWSKNMATLCYAPDGFTSIGG